jgi:hypothetical protein
MLSSRLPKISGLRADNPVKMEEIIKTLEREGEYIDEEALSHISWV